MMPLISFVPFIANLINFGNCFVFLPFFWEDDWDI